MNKDRSLDLAESSMYLKVYDRIYDKTYDNHGQKKKVDAQFLSFN